MLKNKSNTICIIPARKNSVRIKNKNLLKISNKTLVEICINVAKKSKLFKEIILSSDSEKILKIGKKNNITYLKRKKSLSTSSVTTDDVIKDIISDIKYKFKNIVILQVTSPLRRKKTLINFINHCIKKNLQSCLSVSTINDNISEKKKSFNSINGNVRNSQKRKQYIYENGLIYFVTKKFFENNNKIYPKNNWNYFMTDKYESTDINEYKDYLIAKKIYKLK